jgi:biopolymer transport protein ExbD
MLKSSNIYLIVITLIAAAGGSSCSLISSQTSNAKSQPAAATETDDRAGLIKNESDGDWFLLTDREIVLTVSADNKLYREEHSPASDAEGKITKTEITKEQLATVLKAFSESVTPDKRIVHVNVDGNTSYEKVVQIMDLVRKADIDRVGLIAANENRPKNLNAAGFDVKLPLPPRGNSLVKPNPLTLIVQLRPNGGLSLNNEDLGKISGDQTLGDKLSDVLDQREKNAVFRPNSQEIEKTVFVKIYRSAKYIDVLKLLSILKRAGAQPIGMQLDELD